MAGPPTSLSLILQLFILALCHLVHGITVFGDPRLNDSHGAVLLKDGEQTSCEVALISNRFGYVAATCFEVDSELKAMNVSQYEVVFDHGTKSPIPGRCSVANVTINPGLDPKSFANNVAVVAFNSQSIKLWGNYIDRSSAEKSGRIYSRRSITDVMTQKWGPSLGGDDRAIYDYCVDASPVYTANKDAF
ncbi:hypothetical protein EC988_001484 [Linderina pennispora]|nr:hypothetical protein EC988_001484 [Linderina pennispora]